MLRRLNQTLRQRRKLLVFMRAMRVSLPLIAACEQTSVEHAHAFVRFASLQDVT